MGCPGAFTRSSAGRRGAGALGRRGCRCQSFLGGIWGGGFFCGGVVVVGGRAARRVGRAPRSPLRTAPVGGLRAVVLVDECRAPHALRDLLLFSSRSPAFNKPFLKCFLTLVKKGVSPVNSPCGSMLQKKVHRVLRSWSPRRDVTSVCGRSSHRACVVGLRAHDPACRSVRLRRTAAAARERARLSRPRTRAHTINHPPPVQRLGGVQPAGLTTRVRDRPRPPVHPLRAAHQRGDPPPPFPPARTHTLARPQPSHASDVRRCCQRGRARRRAWECPFSIAFSKRITARSSRRRRRRQGLEHGTSAGETTSPWARKQRAAARLLRSTISLESSTFALPKRFSGGGASSTSSPTSSCAHKRLASWP